MFLQQKAERAFMFNDSNEMMERAISLLKRNVFFAADNIF